MNKQIKLFWVLIVFGLIIPSSPLKSAEIPQAKADKGLVVFYRPGSFKGGAIRFNLNHAEGLIGQLLSGTMLYKYVDPGEHQFWAQAISQDAISIKVEAGKTYYVKGVVKMGVVAGRPTFTQVKEEQARKDISNLK